MKFEEQRFLHEDIERLEQAIVDRRLQESSHNRDSLQLKHQIASFEARIQEQSARLLDIYFDKDGELAREKQRISTGDVFDEFYKQLEVIRDHHRKYPNEPVQNLERAYRRGAFGETESANFVPHLDKMFSGEERYGRYFDLMDSHGEYLNLPGVKDTKMTTYLQYLELFDSFTPPRCLIKKSEKMTNAYFQYLGNLVTYLEGFLRRTRPLEDNDKTLEDFDKAFEEAWAKDEVPGWSTQESVAKDDAYSATVTHGMDSTDEGVWCADCEKEFKNENVYSDHLTKKNHKKNAKARAGRGEVGTNSTSKGQSSKSNAAYHLKERAIAEREFRICKLTAAMQTERSDTRVNIERKQGMTDRERQQELGALYAALEEPDGEAFERLDEGDDENGEEKIYNPLKLPLAWDGKPIPFWLYKLHGLGVEFSCEICGNFVYMGRRAFDKHFNEARHIHGLKSLGITHTTLFREITGIDDAMKLWDKIQGDKNKQKKSAENVVQMEDAEGNVMPAKVYADLVKQGLL